MCFYSVGNMHLLWPDNPDAYITSYLTVLHQLLNDVLSWVCNKHKITLDSSVDMSLSFPSWSPKSTPVDLCFRETAGKPDEVQQATHIYQVINTP